MPARRWLGESDRDGARCACGQVARFVLLTESVMGGNFYGTGRSRVNRSYRCVRCAAAAAKRYGLDPPAVARVEGEGAAGAGPAAGTAGA